MHWSDEILEQLRARGGQHVIETGTSISGIPHIGNASDVIRGDCVRKALTEAGQNANLIWISDDSDPFRKVPAGMESLNDYLGHPVKDIPDPQGCHENFVDHFANPFIEDLKVFGVTPIVYSGTELYRKGELNWEIKTAFEKKDKIAKILNKFRETPLPQDWLPWTPMCAGCGKISTTKVTGYDGLKVEYVCETTDVSGGKAQGCGFKGISDASKGEGKMPWRVEWAARWHHFKVTCEPFGKEHAAAGGSYDTSKIVSDEVFGWEPPVPVVYEFFTLNGAKISSSKGNVITLSEWLKIAQPETLKYFMYKRLQKQRDINLSMLPNLVDEYDEAERIYHKKQDGSEDLARIYELAQVGKPKYLNVPFTLCAVLNQVASDDELAEKVNSMGYEGFDVELLRSRVKLAGAWVMKHGPEYLRFKLKTEQDMRKTLNSQPQEIKKSITELVDALGEKLTDKEYHKRIYETARANNIDPPILFTAIYQTLIGKDKGPKAASFLQTLGRQYLKKRLID